MTYEARSNNPKITLVLGASLNPGRYSYLAIEKLRKYGHEVIAVGKDLGQVSDVSIEQEFPDGKEVDTVTLYLNPENQKAYYEKILGLKPKRVIFNPGTENHEFVLMLNQKGIQTEEACTLVLLGTNQYDT